jgi:hypothetical protein
MSSYDDIRALARKHLGVDDIMARLRHPDLTRDYVKRIVWKVHDDREHHGESQTKGAAAVWTDRLKR